MTAAPRRSLPGVLRRLRARGWRGVWYALRDRVAPARPRFLPRARAALAGRPGLEVGGPSRVFRPGGPLPVYAWVRSLDNVNFARETAWEQAPPDGGPYPFARGRPAGTQWVREAGLLRGLADEAYDFVVSSHCLEHLANPLGALGEWRRVTRPGGHLLVIVPDPAFTFDHRRPVTRLEHLAADRAQNMPEDDATHFAEVLALHDLARDPPAGSAAAFRERVYRNAELRCVHHHVFDPALLCGALEAAGWRPLELERFPPIHLAALARKEAR